MGKIIISTQHDLYIYTISKTPLILFGLLLSSIAKILITVDHFFSIVTVANINTLPTLNPIVVYKKQSKLIAANRIPISAGTTISPTADPTTSRVANFPLTDPNMSCEYCIVAGKSGPSENPKIIVSNTIG